MKKLFIILLTCMSAVSSFSQTADFNKAVARFKKASQVSAIATRIDHKAAVANDDKASGSLTISSPNKMNISVDDGKEQLDMNGDNFTMIMRGKEYKANSKTNNQFVAFQAVLTAIINGDGSGLKDVPGVSMTQSGSVISIAMDPYVGQDAKKRMMFTSFIITLDVAKGEMLTLRMNGRGKNYIEYTFSGFSFK